MLKTASISLIAMLAVGVGGASSGALRAAAGQSSSEKVRANPAAQYMLVKKVVGQAIGVVDARARAVEPQGYNLLKYCWTAENVLGDWAERAGLAGEMIARGLEARSWQRDLVRAGYPERPVAEAIGHYEGTLAAARFAAAARTRALENLVIELDTVRRVTPGTAQVRAIHRCERERRSLGLNFTTLPAGGRAQFVPYLLHRLCQAQQLDADDPVRCDYWLNGRADRPMSFAGETVYSVRWADGSTAKGRFDPEQARAEGTVTLRLRPPKVRTTSERAP